MYRYLVFGELRKPTDIGILDLLKQRCAKMREVLGGTPITYEEALELRRLLYGSSINSIGTEFKRMAFCFQVEEGPFPFGLLVERNGCRGVLMAVQAHILQYLIFNGNTREDISKMNVLKPGSSKRREALVFALSDMLWRAGAQTSCCVCLPQDKENFSQSTQYRYDGLTEKLHLYQFNSFEDVQCFLKRNLDFFEGEATSGCLLFLNCLVLSRTIEKIKVDCGSDTFQLITHSEELTQALTNLMVIGQAVQGLQNGDAECDSKGQRLAKPRPGITCRGQVGFLYWNKDEDELNRTVVGSMLKTPRKPIWLTHINGNLAVLFSLNPDLLRDWREEHRFELQYYTGLRSQAQVARLTIDTHQRKGWKIVQAQVASTSNQFYKDDKKKIPALESIISTKWSGAEVDWNGTMPFV